MARTALIVSLAVTPLLLCACSVRLGGSKSLDKTLADLRTENQQLRDELTQTQGKLQELIAREASDTRVNQQMQGVTPIFSPEELALAMPRVVKVAFHSGAGLDLRDPAQPRLVMDIETRDGRDRFVPGVGRLRVTATQNGKTLADVTLSPVELRDAYRSSIMGTRYALEVPVTADALSAPIRLEASLLLATGETLTAERTVAAGR